MDIHFIDFPFLPFEPWVEGAMVIRLFFKRGYIKQILESLFLIKGGSLNSVTS